MSAPSRHDRTSIFHRGQREYWPSPSVVRQLNIEGFLFGRPDAPGLTLLTLLAKHGPKPERVNVGGDTIHWTDTRGAGPLGPAMEIQLLMFSFKHLEGQVSTMQIAHVAQQMVPCLAAAILSHLTGASLEDSEALIGDPQAVEYGRMVFPISAELLQINVQHAEVTEKLKRNDVQVDSLSKNLASATARVKVAEERLKELESKAQKAARIVEDHVETERQLNHFKVQHAEVTKQLKRSEERGKEMESKVQEAARIVEGHADTERQLNHFKVQHAEVTKQLKRSEERGKEMESKVQEAARIVEGHADTERQLNHFKVQHAEVTEQLKRSEERVKEMESKVQEAARIVEGHADTERQLNHFKVQHAEVTEKLKRSEMDAEKRHSDSDQYKDRAASDAVFSLRIQVDSLTRNLASASARAKVAEERVKAIESEVQKAAKIGEGHTERQADQNVRIPPMNPLWRDAARYCIDPRTRTVGAGAHGKVRVLQDNLTRNRVAIKVVRVNQGGAIPQTVERELSFLASSSSDYVVPLLDVIQFVDGGDCYVGMVMPFYPRDLEGVIYDFDRDLTITDITYYATQILSGLDFLARRDIIHCDLKPANLLVTKNNHLFIADFGLAESRVQPQPRRVIASMNYRSPECYFRTMQRSQALDIWAFGVILMEMIGRAVPWDGSTPLDIFNQILQHTGVPYNAEIFPFATKLPGVFSGQDMHSEGPNPPSGEVKFNARPRTLPLSITMYGRGPRERFRDLFSVVDKILVLDPARRPAASRLLESPVFADSDPRGYRQLYPLTSELRASDVAEIRRTRRRM